MVLSRSAIQALEQRDEPLAQCRQLAARQAFRTRIGDETGQQAVQAITEAL